jgi:uncharacterized protein (TIGR02646 family)
MRHIDFSKFNPPAKWKTKADERALALKEEEAKGKTDRDAFIEKNARVWQSLKPELEKLSHGKCWFSEAKETVSHMHVEHFRPKKKVVDVDDSKKQVDGYWWLTFEWSNFRVAGQIPNCKKGNFFPLRDEARRATVAKPAIADEDHLFLDPIKRKDVLLVTYAPDGSMQPRPKVTAWEERRVRKTAECFGLNDFPNLTDARRQVWQDCQLLVDAVFNNLRQSEKCGGSPALEAVAEAKLDELRKMIRESMPFSSVAMACIEGNDPALLKILI